MKTILRCIYVLIILFVITVGICCVGITLRYHDHFMYGTFAGDDYLTGMTVGEAAAVLNHEYHLQSLEVTDIDHRKYTITPDEIGARADYTFPLSVAMSSQNPLSWPLRVGKECKLDMNPVITVDETAAAQLVSGWDMFSMSEDSRDVEIVGVVDDGYQLVNTMEQVPDLSEIESEVIEAFRRGDTELDLTASGRCYRNLELTDQMQSVQDTFTKIDKLQDTGIVYVFGDEDRVFGGEFIGNALVVEEEIDLFSKEKKSKKVPGSGLFIINGIETSWPQDYKVENGFVTDSDGNLILSESRLYDEMMAMCGQFSTVGSERQFMTSKGDTVTITGGTYGNDIDMKSEFSYIIKCLTEGIEEAHEPVYKQTAAHQGSDDIGDTYVEISIADQHLYYYEAGELVLDTDIVTGNAGRGRDTPTGVYYVYGKARNRYLRGRDYVSFVKYWMPVYKGVGIHDASWRRDFGGDIYRTAGSHGCINLPSSVAEELYGLVSVGVPVIIY